MNAVPRADGAIALRALTPEDRDACHRLSMAVRWPHRANTM